MTGRFKNWLLAGVPGDDAIIAEVGKAVVTLAIASWATFLGGYISQGDDNWRFIIAIPLVVSTWLLAIGVALQVFHFKNQSQTLSRAIAWRGFLLVGTFSFGILISTGGFIAGDEKAAFENRARMECLKNHMEKANGVIERQRIASAAAGACINATESSVISIDLALMEKRISQEQHDSLALKAAKMCDIPLKQLKEVDKDASETFREECR